jgi:hypothetical protein
VEEASATIIDFSAYRARKRIASKRPERKPAEPSADVVAIGFYFFWPVLAWMPIGFLLAPSVAEDFT